MSDNEKHRELFVAIIALLSRLDRDRDRAIYWIDSSELESVKEKFSRLYSDDKECE